MSQDPHRKASRREFLGTATAATAVTLTASPASEARTGVIKSAEEIQIAQTAADNDVLPKPANTNDWTKPAAMALPKEGYFKLEQGRFGPIFPKTPANYGFTIIAKIKPGREETIRQYGKTIEKGIADDPSLLAPLKLHYLRWVLFDINNETYFMYQGIFDTDFDKYTEDAIALFKGSGISTVFENLEGFPEDWKTNIPAFVNFMREHQRPSFLEYGEYPYVSSDEIKRALRVKSALSAMLDQMQ
jgi:hypothetical protein